MLNVYNHLIYISLLMIFVWKFSFGKFINLVHILSYTYMKYSCEIYIISIEN